MDEISGYARVFATYRVRQIQHKRFLGKPYVRYDECHALAASFFQIGCTLVCEYREWLDDFGYAFLGVHGEAGAFFRFCSMAVKKQVAMASYETSILDYVNAEQLRRFGYSGTTAEFLCQNASTRIQPAGAIELAWQFAEKGVTLGAVYPDLVRNMLELTHKGTAIDVNHYREQLAQDKKLFSEYCREFCPDLPLAEA